MSWQDWVGNASYLLLAASYLVTSIVWLRLLAIAALSIEAVYFYVVGEQELWVGILWAAVFNTINIVQLILLARAHLRVRMSDEEKTLHASAFGKLEKLDFNRILAVGEFQDLADGTEITSLGRPVKDVHLLLSGRALVIVDGAIIARLNPGDFVGEMAFISDCDASATVITDGACRSFRIGIDQLRALTGRHEKIDAAMNAQFSVDLARKLRTRPLTTVARYAAR